MEVMDGIGTIAGAAVSAGSALTGGIKAGRYPGKQGDILDARARENDRWYQAEYYKDVLDNPESRAYLKVLMNRAGRRDRAIGNDAVATGATNERALAARQAVDEDVSRRMGGLAERQSAKRNEIRREYIGRRNGIGNSRAELTGAKAGNWINTMGTIAQAAKEVVRLF